MNYQREIKTWNEIQPKPKITSYDSGQEHSIEHLIEVRTMVAESEEEKSVTDLPRVPMGRAAVA